MPYAQRLEAFSRACDPSPRKWNPFGLVENAPCSIPQHHTKSGKAFALAVGILLAAITARSQTTTIKFLPQPAGSFTEALSTSFQLAPWTDSTFTAHPELLPELTQLNPHHINVQVIDKSIPETAPGAWDFTALDHQLQPILTAADHSPLVQLANAPAFLYRSKTHFVTPAFIAGYAEYAAKMVAHYNAAGSPHPVQYWGVLNEPNYFHISPAEYVALYNAAVPAMLAVDPTIRIAALELGGEPSDERAYLPTFIRDVKAPVDILAVHFYATCDQNETDRTVFDTVPSFVAQLQYIHRQLRTRPELHDVPIWILENNVNADFIGPHGESVCNPTQSFVEDTRGGSAFFAAWRAYEFSRFGQSGAHALYQWDFSGDKQYGEIDTKGTPARPQLSFWVDLWLGRYFPPQLPATILKVNNPDSTNIEVLAVRESSGKLVVLISNHTVTTPTDNNGKGTGRTVLLDLGALGRFHTGTQLTLDAATDLVRGPTEQQVTPQPKMKFSLNGYGATLLTFE
jgi:hypothetical protein